MRYLIFNVTVLAALGYLFMASPDQSFANWIGKAPQMFDAARTAGRDQLLPGDDATMTAGGALLQAMEPVVEQVLASSDDASPASMSRTTSPKETSIVAARPDADAESGNRPVTIQDIESMIRALLDAGVAPAGNQGQEDSAAALVNSAQGVVIADETVGNSVDDTVDDTGEAGPATMIADAAVPADQPSFQEMSDADIAAAFEQLQNAARPRPVTSDAGQSPGKADLAAGAAYDAPAEDGTPASTVLQSPDFMSPAQRADSLALMVEELQLMYLERTGG